MARAQQQQQQDATPDEIEAFELDDLDIIDDLRFLAERSHGLSADDVFSD